MNWIDQSPIAKKLKREHLQTLKQAVKESGKEFTAKQVANNLRVSPNIVRGYLKKLMQEGLLILAATKKKRTVTYLAPGDLKDQLLLKN